MRGYVAGELTPHPKVDFSKSVMLTEQHHKDEVDVTTIVRRFGMTGQMPKMHGGGVYGDFSGVTDYETAREALERAEAGFRELDPEIRARFDNSPGFFLRLAEHDPEAFGVRFLGPGKVEPSPAGTVPSGAGGADGSGSAPTGA